MIQSKNIIIYSKIMVRFFYVAFKCPENKKKIRGLCFIESGGVFHVYGRMIFIIEAQSSVILVSFI